MRGTAFLFLLFAGIAYSQTLSSQTYGGSGSDTSTGVAVDSTGNIYVVGTTTSFDLPLVNASQTSNRGTQLVYSPDAGLTWQALPNITAAPATGLTNPVIAADPGNADVFYTASGNRIYRTSDRGRTFTAADIPSLAGQAAISGLAVDPANSNVIYAGAGRAGVFKSSDAGATWTSSSNGLPTDVFVDSVVIDPFSKALWVWGGNGGYVSADGAATWTRSSLQMPQGSSISGGLHFVFDARQPGVIYGPELRNVSVGLQKSADGGLTWTSVNAPFSGANLVADPVRSGWLYSLATAQAFNGPSVLYRSSDGGATWQSFAVPAFRGGHLAIDPADPNILIAGTFRSSDGGQTWSPTAVARDITPVFAPSGGGVLYASAPVTSDVFLAKYLPDGKTLVFATYFGGMGDDSAAGVKVDRSGNIWIAGTTGSYDLPVSAGAAQPLLRGSANGFIAEFAPDGTLSYCTYLGSSGADTVTGLALDSAGAVWIAGQSTALDFPAAGKHPISSSITPATYVFAAKLDAVSGGLAYAAYMGGSNLDRAGRIAVDSSDNVIVTGTTWSADFPVTPGVYQAAVAPTLFLSKAFVVKLDSSGSTIFSTYFGGAQPGKTHDGGNGTDQAGVAVGLDATGNIYVTGNTGFSDFPTTTGAYQATLHGGCGYPAFQLYTGLIGTINRYYDDDVFVTKLSPDGMRVIYSTLVGGSCYDRPSDLAVGGDGSVYLTGETDSGDFPLIQSFEGAPSTGQYQSFVAALDPTGSALVFGSYLTAGANPSLVQRPDGAMEIAGAVGRSAQTASLVGGPFGNQAPLTNAYIATFVVPVRRAL